MSLDQTTTVTQLPGRNVLLDLYRRMARIRLFESAAGSLMESGRLPGFLHLYVGQEAVAAGVMSTLDNRDQITSTHRGHGHAIAKGGDFKRMFAELYGREDGYSRGRGGSMHINDLSIGMLGANGIVGAGIPIAVGAAFANAYRGSDRVAVTFFGDGASNSGAFHEAANLAAVLGLPVVLVCENNGYAEYTPQARHMLPASPLAPAPMAWRPRSVTAWMPWPCGPVLSVRSSGRDPAAARR
jgi:pyruvate dehydrogenase E1 component alpha subunit